MSNATGPTRTSIRGSSWVLLGMICSLNTKEIPKKRFLVLISSLKPFPYTGFRLCLTGLSCLALVVWTLKL